jgi:hypothetical protein
MDGDTLGEHFTSGVEFRKFWSELKSLHGSHKILSEAFQNIQLLQNSTALETLATKKGNTLREGKLTKLTTSLSNEVNIVQGIV